MNVWLLSLFVAVAQRGSFAAVARDRGLDPSSVSRAIASLEADLGTRLFQRSTRTMTLTEAGELYLARLPTLIDNWSELQDEVSSLGHDPVGTVRLTASVAFGQKCLVPLLPRFQASFPRLQLELLLVDANVDIVADRVDVAIRLGPSFRADVIGSRLIATRYRVVASPVYLDRSGRPAKPSELASHNCLLFALTDFRTRWQFRDATHQLEPVSVRGQLVFSNALALHAAALMGLGPALLPDWLVADDLNSGALSDVFPTHDVTATSFDTAAWLLYSSRRYLPEKTRRTIDFLKSCFRSTK